MSHQKYHLISFNLCPFVQRSVITLEERGVAYDITYIDLNDKPEWFLQISPFGKVPILKVDETVIFESAVINEFVDETAPGTRFLPESALEKAYQRAWIEYASHLIVAQYLYTMAPDEGGFKEHAQKVKQALSRLEEQVKGPLFSGGSFSLMDAATAPALQRLAWCEGIYEMGLFADVPRVQAWTEALLKRPAVQRSTIEGIEGVFKEYLQGRGSPTRSEPPSYLGGLVR